jgi:hypothetical protein
MFTPNAPWQNVAAHTQVFKLYGSYIAHAPQEQINTVVADLNRRHIDIALETGVINVGPASTNPPCGGLGIVEGYGTPAQAKRISEMIKTAGGTIRYLAMDEPLYYGHFSDRPHTCHSPISTIIQQIVPTLQAYREEFPDIVIGEVEPTRYPEYDDWQAAVSSWAQEFRHVVGKPIAFMQLDIPWSDNGGHVPGAARPSKQPEDTLTFHAYLRDLRRQGLLGEIGIIYDGTPKDTTDAAWVQDAKEHVALLEGKYHLRPEQSIFQSWMPNPARALPESQPDTLMGLANWYLQWRAEHLNGSSHSQ